jgi:hypothetical protein
MKAIPEVIHKWHVGRIVILWVGAVFAGFMLLVWHQSLDVRATELREGLLAHYSQPDNPFSEAALRLDSTARALLAKYAGADSTLWSGPLPEEGTREGAAVETRRREVWDRLTSSVQRDDALADVIIVLVWGVLPLGLLTVTWVWFGGKPRAVRVPTRIPEWHPGKLVIIWLAAAVLFYALVFETFPFWERTQALAVWAVLVVPAVVITWKWFSGRERRHE